MNIAKNSDIVIYVQKVQIQDLLSNWLACSMRNALPSSHCLSRSSSSVCGWFLAPDDDEATARMSPAAAAPPEVDVDS
jgi:hypothetical protein